MRQLTDSVNTHRGVLAVSPAGGGDTVTTITRRDGRVYEVVTNESMGYVGLCELVKDERNLQTWEGDKLHFSNIFWIDLAFWDGDAASELRGKDGYFKSPRWIVAQNADSFEK